LSLLNSTEIRSQDPKSHISIALYHGSETKPVVEKFLGPVFQKIDTIMNEINELFLVPDLAGLGKMSDLKVRKCFCPFCNTLEVRFFFYLYLFKMSVVV
jgi:hypothetical protein